MDKQKLDGCRALIGAILEQAYCDAVSSDRLCNPQGARNFLNKDNPLFSHYCGLLQMEPEYVAAKMQQRIKEHDEKKYESLKWDN